MIYTLNRLLTANQMAEITRNYIPLGDKRYDAIEAGIRKSYPNSCVLWIEEVCNPDLEEAYTFKKQEIETLRGKPCGEAELYHGTRKGAVATILRDGFDPTVNKRSAYGKGSYFAAQASYSREYAPPASDEISYMLICSVLIGSVGTYGDSKVIDTTKHDLSVNNLKTPTIYAMPYKEGAVPRYVVAFHRNAKAIG